MTEPERNGAAGVRCPICLDVFAWPTDAPLYEFRERAFHQLKIPKTNRAKDQDIRRTAYLRCPNPSGDAESVHYLPATYGLFGPPLVIGLVGATRSGKTHLLTAMIAAIERGDLQPYGLTWRPVDFALHDSFMRDRVNPLVTRGRRLPRTDENITTYADALLVTSPAGTRPVTFFDVAGGDLVKTGRTARFLAGAGGLIFVVDPDTALRLDPDDGRPDTGLGDRTFATVLGRLNPGALHLDIPAAVVLTKADRLRFHPPADVWLRRNGTGRVDAAALRAESRDVFAFLHARGSAAALRPFHECRRCTLHFVSATGGEAVDDGFPRGVRPHRVLEPLLALFAMTGILPGASAVGRW